MSILLQAMLFEKYGPRLDLDDLADALSMSKSTIYNQMSAGTFPVKTYLDGKRYADVRDVAEHLDEKRKEAV
jgi:predicted DNA-binding transcriptional regulator AlpA